MPTVTLQEHVVPAGLVAPAAQAARAGDPDNLVFPESLEFPEDPENLVFPESLEFPDSPVFLEAENPQDPPSLQQNVISYSVHLRSLEYADLANTTRRQSGMWTSPSTEEVIQGRIDKRNSVTVL